MNANISRLRTRVDEPQQAFLIQVVAGVEHGNPVSFLLERRVPMQCGQESPCRTKVDQHIDVQFAGQRQTPNALASANTSRQTLGGVAPLKVGRVEVLRLARADRHDHRFSAVSGGIGGADVDLSAALGMIDDSHEALAPAIGRHWEHGHVERRSARNVRQKVQIVGKTIVVVIGIRVVADAIPIGIRGFRAVERKGIKRVRYSIAVVVVIAPVADAIGQG